MIPTVSNSSRSRLWPASSNQPAAILALGNLHSLIFVLSIVDPRYLFYRSASGCFINRGHSSHEAKIKCESHSTLCYMLSLEVINCVLSVYLGKFLRNSSQTKQNLDSVVPKPLSRAHFETQDSMFRRSEFEAASDEKRRPLVGIHLCYPP